MFGVGGRSEGGREGGREGGGLCKEEERRRVTYISDVSGARCSSFSLPVIWWREGGRKGGREGGREGRMGMRAWCTVRKEVYKRKAGGFMTIGRQKNKH